MHRTASMAWLVAALATIGLACEGDPREADWQFVFASELAADRAIAVEGAVLEGGCDGEVLHVSQGTRGRAPETPPVLPAGRYGLRGVASDFECLAFAFACVEVELPLDEADIVRIELGERASEERSLCDRGVCRSGACECAPEEREGCDGVDDDCDDRIDETAEGGVYQACPGAVVISELAPAGPAGELDEIVELYNRRELPVTLDGASLVTAGPGTATRPVLEAYLSRAGDAEIPPYGYYLVGGCDVEGADANACGAAALETTGGVVSLARTIGGDTVELDRIGWGANGAAEGDALPALADESQSYERRPAEGVDPTGSAEEECGNAYDSNDNGSDFVVRAVRDPQAARSRAEPWPECDR